MELLVPTLCMSAIYTYSVTKKKEKEFIFFIKNKIQYELFVKGSCSLSMTPHETSEILEEGLLYSGIKTNSLIHSTMDITVNTIIVSRKDLDTTEKIYPIEYQKKLQKGE